MNEFFAKLLQMNNMLVVLDPNTTKCATNELSKIVAKILPGRLAIDCIKQGGKRLQTESKIKALLSTLEEVDAISSTTRVKFSHELFQVKFENEFDAVHTFARSREIFT